MKKTKNEKKYELVKSYREPRKHGHPPHFGSRMITKNREKIQKRISCLNENEILAIEGEIGLGIATISSAILEEATSAGRSAYHAKASLDYKELLPEPNSKNMAIAIARVNRRIHPYSKVLDIELAEYLTNRGCENISPEKCSQMAEEFIEDKEVDNLPEDKSDPFFFRLVERLKKELKFADIQIAFYDAQILELIELDILIFDLSHLAIARTAKVFNLFERIFYQIKNPMVIIFRLEQQKYSPTLFHRDYHFILEPFLMEQLVDHYVEDLGDTLPFSKEALFRIAAFSRGYPDRFKKYISHCFSRRSPNTHISDEDVTEIFYEEGLIQEVLDMELGQIFQKWGKRMVAIEILLHILKNGETLQKDLKEIATPATLSNVLKILENSNFVMLKKNENGDIAVQLSNKFYDLTGDIPRPS